MSVNPSTPILAADLAALGALANSKNIPKTINDGTPYNYLAPVLITSKGTGYKPGDLLSFQFNTGGFSLEVVAVDAVGGIRGWRVLNAGIFVLTNNQPSSPKALTGGSGTGAAFSFTLQPVALDVDGLAVSGYSFTDNTELTGNIISTYIHAAGWDYQVGDRFLYPWPAGRGHYPLTITVSAVNSDGAITGISDNVADYPGIVPFESCPLSPVLFTGGHGAGAQIGLVFSLNHAPWLTELNRLRTNLFDGFASYYGVDVSSTPTGSVSGYWPVGGPNGNLKNLGFYYEDRGHSETVTISIPPFISSRGEYSTTVVNFMTVDGQGNPNGVAPRAFIT